MQGQLSDNSLQIIEKFHHISTPRPKEILFFELIDRADNIKAQLTVKATNENTVKRGLNVLSISNIRREQVKKGFV